MSHDNRIWDGVIGEGKAETDIQESGFSSQWT